MLQKLLFFQIFWLILIPKIFAQEKWVFPINPNQESYLTGNMGEIRGSHFHAGLDILASENTPVHATAKGYVAKVIISPYGYGKLLYIKHPDRKKMSLYAHLNGFAENIEPYILQQQYQQQSFEITLEFLPEQFPVEAGQIVAYSGNTGFSAGSHLHFEIRDEQDKILNPSLFGFEELPEDHLPPTLQYLALSTLSPDALVENDFGTWIRSLPPNKNGVYQIKKPIQVWGTIGVELVAHDIAEKSTNTYATTSITVFLDGKEVYSFQMNPYQADLARSMNQHINYAAHRKNNLKLQRAYLSDGNLLRNLYKTDKQQGKLQIRQKKRYTLEIKVQDVWKNTSVLTVELQGSPPPATSFEADKRPFKENISYEIFENTLQISAKHLKFGGEKAVFTMYGLKFEIPLAYQKNGVSVYLWDLRKGLPQFVQVGGQQIRFHFRQIIPPKRAWIYQDSDMRLEFSAETLFDTLYLEVFRTSQGIRLSNNYIPIFKPFTLKIWSFKTKNKTENNLLYWAGSSRQESFWKNDTLIAEVQNLGDLLLLEDRKPPTIKLITKNPLPTFQIQDNLSGIESYKATINGEYLMLEYEPKLKQLKAKPLKPDVTFSGKKIVLHVLDGAGNPTIFEQTL